jgi:hypothetical protein
VGKPERKRPLEKPRRRWKDTINMALQEIGWDGVDWIGSGYRQVAGCCEHGDEHSDSMQCGEFLDQLRNY